MTVIAFPIAGRGGERGDWSKARPGGADHSTLTLATELVQHGVTPVVIVHGDGPTVDYVEHLGLKAIVVDFAPVDKRAKLTDDIASAVLAQAEGVGKLIRDNRVDIVHTNDASLHRTWGLLKERAPFRHVWHERGLFQHPEISQRHLAAAEEVITISRFVAGRAPEAVRNRVRIIDNPVRLSGDFDRASDRAWLLQEFGLPPDARVFTMIANGNPRKRWNLFFEAASIASRVSRSFYFLCVGYTIVREVKDLIRTNFTDDNRSNLVVCGYRYDAHRIISGSDALVATAKDEPLGRTVIEAGMLGTPIIAADSGGHKELLANTAPMCLVGPSHTGPAFAEAFANIDRLVEKFHSARPVLQSQFLERFSPQAHVRAVLDVYRDQMR